MLVSGRFWAGWDDELQENHYANTVTGEPLAKDFWPFYPGEPNGERMENCVAVWVAKNAWNDFSCTWKSHPFCYIKTRYVLHATLLDPRHKSTLNARFSYELMRRLVLPSNFV